MELPEPNGKNSGLGFDMGVTEDKSVKYGRPQVCTKINKLYKVFTD